MEASSHRGCRQSGGTTSCSIGIHHWWSPPSLPIHASRRWLPHQHGESSFTPIHSCYLHFGCLQGRRILLNVTPGGTYQFLSYFRTSCTHHLVREHHLRCPSRHHDPENFSPLILVPAGTSKP